MLTIQHWPGLVAGAALLILAAWALILSPRNRLHRGFALFALTRALMSALGRFTQDNTPLHPDRFGEIAAALYPYLQIAAPFALANFAVLFVATYGRVRSVAWRRSWRTAILVACVLVEAWYFADHRAYIRSATEDGPLYIALPLTLAVSAWVGWLVGRGALHPTNGCDPHAFLLFSLGFVAEPLYYAIDFDPVNLASDASNWMEWTWVALFWATIAAAAILVVSVVAFRRRHGPTPVPRHLSTTLLFLGLVCVTAAVTLIWGRQVVASGENYTYSAARTTHLFLNAFWLLVLVGLASYAILRYKILTIDVRLKQILREGTTAAALTAVFFIVEQVLQLAVQSTLPPFGWADLLVNILAGAAVALGLMPAHRLAARLANRLLPTVDDSPDYRRQRAAKIYRAAFQQAHRDGSVTHRERTALQRLAATLNISAAQAAGLEKP
ncbi:MAG: hypothetical protein V4510_07390 [bacterium]